MPDREAPEPINSSKTPEITGSIRANSEALERFARISESIGRDLLGRNELLRETLDAMSTPSLQVDAIQNIVKEWGLLTEVNDVSEIGRRHLSKFNEALEFLRTQQYSQFQKWVDEQENLFQGTAAAISGTASLFGTLDNNRISDVLKAAFSSAERDLVFAVADDLNENDQDDRVTVFVFMWVVNAARSLGIFDTGTIASIFVTVVFALVQLNISQNDVAEITARLDRLVESVESVAEMGVNRRVVVTTSELNLRDQPAADAEVVTILRKGDEAVVIRSEGAWLYLKHFNLNTAKTFYGWSHSAYTRSND